MKILPDSQSLTGKKVALIVKIYFSPSKIFQSSEAIEASVYLQHLFYVYMSEAGLTWLTITLPSFSAGFYPLSGAFQDLLTQSLTALIRYLD